MAWTAVNNSFTSEIIILYLAAIFWTLGYDTIYGAQDMSQDEIIGLKSTSIKFKKNIKFFVFFSYLITILLMVFLFREIVKINFFSLVLIMFILSLLVQIINFNKDKPETCLNMFKLNNLSGLLLFVSILLINN